MHVPPSSGKTADVPPTSMCLVVAQFENIVMLRRVSGRLSEDDVARAVTIDIESCDKAANKNRKAIALTTATKRHRSFRLKPE